MEGYIDLFRSFGIGSQLHGRAHDHRPVVVGSTLALPSLPDKTTTIGNDASGDSGAVVSTPPDEHHTDLAHLAVDFEVVGSGLRVDDELVVGSTRHFISVVDILTLDFIVSVDNIGRIDGKQGSIVRATRPVHSAIGGSIRVRVRSHCVYKFRQTAGQVIQSRAMQ